MPKLLIDKMKSQFEKSGFKVTKDCFEKQCQWLSIKHKTIKKFGFEITFNWSGTKIISMDAFKEEKIVTNIIDLNKTKKK